MELISQIILLLAIGIIFALVAKSFKMPQIVGYIIAGLVFSFFNKYEDHESITLLSEIGITLLLFTVGVEFSLAKLEKVKKFALLGGSLQIIFSILICVIILPTLGFSLYNSLFLGSIFSLSSTAVIVKILEDKGDLESFTGQITLGWLILQDIAVVVIIILLSSFAGENFSFSILFESLIKSTILIALALVVGRKLIPRILLTISKKGSKDILLVTAFAFALFFAFIAEQLGISSTLGAFLAGLMISESVYNHEIFTEIKPLQTIFSMLFFITIGTLFSFDFFIQNISTIILLGFFGLFSKIFITLLINFFFRLHPKINFNIAIYLSQVGEFAFLISQIALVNKWIDTSFATTILSLTILSLIISPLIINQSGSFYLQLLNILKRNYPNSYRKLFNKVHIEGLEMTELNNHIVICGYGRVGKYVAKGLERVNEQFIVVELNEAIFNNEYPTNYIIGDAVNPDILNAAKIETARICVIAMPKDSDVDEIIRLAKEFNPDIKIITRSHGNINQDSLNSVYAVIEQEFEASLIIIQKTLQFMNKRDKKIVNYLREIKEQLS